MSPRLVTFRGPWSGIEERENFQGDNHASISLNVDYSRGYIEARPGTESLNDIGILVDGGDTASHTFALRGRVHIHRPENGDFRVITMATRTDVSNHDNDHNYIEIAAGSHPGCIWFTAFDMNGNELGDPVNLTTTLDEPTDERFRCSFVDAIRADSSDGVVIEPRYVTLIMTKNNSYVYDPYEDPGGVRKVTIAKDAFHDNTAEYAYWDEPPFGNICVRHQQQYFFSGFRPQDSVLLTDEPPNNNTVKSWISPGTLEMKMVPEQVFFTEAEHIADVPYFNNLITEIGERVTGMYSFLETLVVFSERSIYTVTSMDMQNYSMVRVVNGVGCVAPDSIVQVGDVLYFMGTDGVYGFTGAGTQGAVTKISDPITSLFTGEYPQTQVPQTVLSTLRDHGWPWHIDRAGLDLSNGLHVKSKEQIWWSVPVKTDARNFTATLVFDYVRKAWSIYTARSQGNNTFFYSGATAFIHGKEVVYILDALGRLKRFGMGQGGGFDTGKGVVEFGESSDTTKYAPVMCWVSGRLFKENESTAAFRPIRIKAMAAGGEDLTGLSGTTLKWFAEGEEAHSDAVYLDGAGANQATAAANRQATSGDLILWHGNGEQNMKQFWSIRDIFGTWASSNPLLWTATDWISVRVDPGSVKSKSFRVGFIDDGGEARPPALKIQSFAVETDAGGGDMR